MLLNLIILIGLLFGLLIVSLVIMIYVFNELLKEESNESFIFLIIIGIVIIFLIPIILGMTQKLF